MKILEVRRIFAGYGKSEILHGVTIDLEKNESITVIGPNGAGKSTLIKAILGYLPIFDGEIYWKGEDVTRLKPHEKIKSEIRQHIPFHSDCLLSKLDGNPDIISVFIY